MPPSTSKPVQIANCHLCKLLRLDDTGFGVREDKTADGRSFFCLDVDGPDAWPTEGSVEDVYPGLLTLSTSAEKGCTMCSFLRDVLKSGDIRSLFSDLLSDSDDKQGVPITVSAIYHWRLKHFIADQSSDRDADDNPSYVPQRSKLRRLELRVRINDPSRSSFAAMNGLLSFRIYCTTAKLPECQAVKPDDEVAHWLGLDQDDWLSQEHSSTEALDWVRSALPDCVSHHPCGEEAGEFYLPTRLIEIGQTAGALRLVRSDDIRKGLVAGASIPRYTALSYCWGKPNTASPCSMTTSKNEASQMVGFKLNDLPKTLQEAIAITKALSLSYIWIDALCILQGVDSDWVYESTQLVNIYASAYVTICSLTSSSYLSCLEPERPTTNITFQSSINPAVSGRYSVSYLDLSVNKLGWESNLDMDDRVQHSRWFSRGWTYLELLSSNRALLVRLPHLTLLCSEQDCSWAEGSQIVRNHLPNLHRLPHEKDALYAEWLVVVSRYMGRVFTFRHDILPALSGAASRFAECLGGDEYAAGIWKSDLVRGLVWCHPNNWLPPPEDLTQLLSNLGSGQSNNFTVPSWSWASRQDIAFQHADKPLLQCRADVSVTADGQNPYGRVKGGQLTITGRLYDMGPATHGRKKTPRTYSRLIRLANRYTVHCFFDFAVAGDSVQGNFRLALIGRHEASGPLSWELGLGDSCYRGKIAVGLILHEAQPGGPFFRVGMFEALAPKRGIHRLFRASKVETVTII